MSVNVKQSGQLTRVAGLYHGEEYTVFGISGIDLSNNIYDSGAITSNFDSYSYTVQQDCWMQGVLKGNGSSTAQIFVNGVFALGNMVSASVTSYFPVKKGDVLTLRNVTNAEYYIRLYGFSPQGYGYISSGDIYSLQERQVGCWTDGKPLYQKTLYATNVALSANGRTVVFSNSDLSSLSIDEVVGEIDGFADFNNGANIISIPYAIANTSGSIGAYYDNGYGICIHRLGNALTLNNLYLTIQYTKTTDVAGSGEYVPSGDKAEYYDNTEQVIGTYFGETLYRRTIQVTGLSKATSSTVCVSASDMTTYGINASNIKKLDFAMNYSVSGASNIFTQNTYLNSSNLILVWLASGAVYYQAQWGSASSVDISIDVTIEYTKSSS